MSVLWEDDGAEIGCSSQEQIEVAAEIDEILLQLSHWDENEEASEPRLTPSEI